MIVYAIKRLYYKNDFPYCHWLIMHIVLAELLSFLLKSVQFRFDFQVQEKVKAPLWFIHPWFKHYKELQGFSMMTLALNLCVNNLQLKAAVR